MLAQLYLKPQTFNFTSPAGCRTPLKSYKGPASVVNYFRAGSGLKALPVLNLPANLAANREGEVFRKAKHVRVHLPARRGPDLPGTGKRLIIIIRLDFNAKRT